MRTWLFVFTILCSFPAFAQKQTENVFLITLDGLRWQELFGGADSSLIGDKLYVHDPEALRSEFWAPERESRRQALMPFFWQVIAREGQLFGNRELGNKVNCTNRQWFSYPGYSEILCGFADDQRITSNDKIPNPNTTVLEYINSLANYRGKVAAFGSWDVFPYIINEERSGIPVNAGFEPQGQPNPSAKEAWLNEMLDQIPKPWGTVRYDAFTHHFALEYIRIHQPRVVYVAFGETDDFAHDGKYDAYLKSAHQTDAFIKELWNYVQQHPAYKGKTSFIITTDHGRGTQPKESWRSHGKEISGADQIWIAVMGPDTPARGEINFEGQYHQNQVAATVAALLGLEYPSNVPAGGPIAGATGSK